MRLRALCVDDVDYINFRNQVRDKSWQANFLSKSTDERRDIASNIKNESNIAVSYTHLTLPTN